MVTKNDIILLISTDKEIKGIARIITKGRPIYEDLFQELIVSMLQVNESKLIELHNKKQLKFYLTRMMKNMYYNKYSQFNKLYLQREELVIDFNVQVNEEQPQEELINEAKLKQIIAGLSLEERELVMLDVEYSSIQKLSADIGVDRTTLHNWINRIKTKIKKKYGKV